MNKLKTLKICGYKTIRDLHDFQPHQINVLIGENACGKSNFISFFRFLSYLSEGQLQDFVSQHGFASAFLLDGGENVSRIKAKLSFETDRGLNEYAFDLAHAAADTLIFAEEKFRFSDSQFSDSAPWRTGDTGHKESLLVRRAEEGDETAKFIRGCLRRCIVHQFHNTSEKARIRQAWHETDNRYLKEDGANLAPVLLRLREEAPSYYQRIIAHIRQVFPQFLDFVLEPSGGKLLLQWKERGTDVIFGPHQASDGTLRVMALFTLLLQPPDTLPIILILDEPELGLHPHAIDSFAGLVKGVSHHTQVILATQSAKLVDYFEPEDIVVMSRPNRVTEFSRLGGDELKEWLENYSMAELWEKNVIGPDRGWQNRSEYAL